LESAYEAYCCHVHCIRLDNGSAWYGGGAWGAAILDATSPESCVAVVYACMALGSKREEIDHRGCMHILSKRAASRFRYGKYGMHCISRMRDGRYGFNETHDHFDHFISEHFFSAQYNDHTCLLTLPRSNHHSTRTAMALNTSIACDNDKYQCAVSLNFILALSRRNIDSVLGSPV
jgi:hypothetical protein